MRVDDAVRGKSCFTLAEIKENFSVVFYKVCFSNYTYPKLIYSESSSNTTSQSTAITFNAYRIFLSCNMAVFQECTIKAFPIVGINSIKAHAIGWSVTFLSLGQPTAPHAHHYALLNILFGKPDGKRDEMLICRNECEEPVSSIKCSSLKKTDGKIALDKSSEANLYYEEQAFWSTQIATAYMYLLWGEFNKYLPSNRAEIGDVDPAVYG